jgi:hypothetical protein
MKRSLISVSLAGVVLLGLGFVAADARAYDYQGQVTRTLCPAHAIAGRWTTSWYNYYTPWQRTTGLCGVLSQNDGENADGWFAMPLDNLYGTQNVTVNVAVHGTENGAGSYVCATSYAYGEDGNFMTTEYHCSTGTYPPTSQVLTNVVSVPAGGGVITDINGQFQSTVDMLSMTFISQG